MISNRACVLVAGIPLLGQLISTTSTLPKANCGAAIRLFLLAGPAFSHPKLEREWNKTRTKALFSHTLSS